MEENQTPSLFSLSIDPVTKVQLSETAKWARFLAIVGIIGVILLVVGGVVYSIWVTSMMQSIQANYGVRNDLSTGVGFGSALIFILMAVIAFFPMMYMLRFSNQMKRALNANDQESLNSSFQNLKVYFRYLGIITIIGLGLWVFWIIIFGITAVTVR